MIFSLDLEMGEGEPSFRARGEVASELSLLMTACRDCLMVALLKAGLAWLCRMLPFLDSIIDSDLSLSEKRLSMLFIT